MLFSAATVITVSSEKSEPRTRSPISRVSSMTVPSMGEPRVVRETLVWAFS